VSALPEPSGAPTEPLREGLRQLDVLAPQTAERLLNQFLDEIARWNPRFGFVKAANRQELIVKHVLDSLAAWRQVKSELKGGAVLDVGSGAGFPGIPLAIALPDVSFTLLERSTKKASFLRTCKVLLGLVRVEVVQGDLANAVTQPFDVVTFRAVAPVSRFLDDSRRSGLRFQTIVAYKGRVERASAEIDDVRRSMGDVFRAEVVPVKVPFLGEERCLLVLRTSPGDDRY
jgi:16S rRNA (guanine527-N7)-methyltransferase